MLLLFLSLAVFRFNLNKLSFKWYKVPTMLLEKVSMHTEILFVQCYNFFFFLLLVLFLCLLKIVYYCLNVFVVFLGIVHLWFCYPFTQICIIGHKGTIFSQNSCKYKIQYYLKKSSSPYGVFRNTGNFFSFNSSLSNLCNNVHNSWNKKKWWEQVFL